MTQKTLLSVLVLSLVAAAANAATFVVPTDRELIHRTDAIIIGTALVSYAQPTSSNGIETVTSISVEEVIKGSGIGDTLNVVEPGGVFGNRAMLISGVPRFEDGQHVVLFLKRTGSDRFSATDFVLGKFRFENHGQQMLLLRDEDEIVGWDPDLHQHREPRRAAAPFLQFIRDEVHGQAPTVSYLTTESVAPSDKPSTTGSRFIAAPAFVAAALAFSANSYTMIMRGR